MILSNDTQFGLILNTWSYGPPALRPCGSESQVREDRLSYKLNLFMFSGVSKCRMLSIDLAATEG